VLFVDRGAVRHPKVGAAADAESICGLRSALIPNGYNPHMSTLGSERPFQFSLRAIFVAVGVVAISCGVVPALSLLFPNTETGYLLFSMLAGCIAVLVGGTAGLCVSKMLGSTAQRPWARLLLSLAALFAFVACCYLVWVRSRWMNVNLWMTDPRMPRSWPYADQFLNDYAAWLDERNPATQGLKIHGEFETVLNTLNGLSIVALFAAALFVVVSARTIVERFRASADGTFCDDK